MSELRGAALHRFLTEMADECAKAYKGNGLADNTQVK